MGHLAALCALLLPLAAVAGPFDTISDPFITGPNAPGGLADQLEDQAEPAPPAGMLSGSVAVPVAPDLPVAPDPPMAPPPPMVRAPSEPALVNDGRRARRIRPERRTEDPNFRGGFSLFDAETLDAGEIGFLLSIGFPYITTRLQMAAAERVDWGLELNSIWGGTAAVSTFVKYRLKESPEGDFGFAVRVAADYTHYRDLAARGRWTQMVGIRDFSVTPGVIVSAKTGSGSAYFIDVGGHLTLDTDPQDTGPLSKQTDAVSLGVNIPVRLGAEWSLSKHSNFYGITGVDLLLRKKDNPAAFYIAVGIAFMG